MEYPGLLNKAKAKDNVSDITTVSSIKELSYNSKSGSIAEVAYKGVKELAVDDVLPRLFYISINNNSIGDIAYADGNKILSILEDLTAVYYDLNNQKKILNYQRVAILELIYREYTIYDNLTWKNLNNIKLFAFRTSKVPYIYNGNEWEQMDYVQKSDFVFDDAPTQGSSNLLTSEVIYNELNNKADLINGKVPSDLLPSYVDDVIEFPNFRDFPLIGESGKIYIDISTSTCYRWTGSIYKEIQSPIELDEYPILNSTNAIESGGVYSALLEKLDVIPDLPEIRLKAETALQTETDPTIPLYVKDIKQSDITNWNNKLSLETDPIFSESPAATITDEDISNWNNPSTFLIVEVEKVNNDYVLDGTLQELIDAYDNGRQVMLYFKGIYTCVTVNEDGATFFKLDPETAYFDGFTVNPDNSVDYWPTFNILPYLVSGTSIKTINSSSILGSGNVDLLTPNYCPIIEDTRSSAVAAITGIAPFASLENGQRIVLHLNYNTAASTTLQLTLSNNTTTNDIPIYKQDFNGIAQFGYNHGITGAYLEIIYNQSSNRWIMIGYKDNNTTYASMPQSRIDEGTATGNYVVSPKLLRDNFYTETEVDTALSGKQNTLTFDDNPTQSSNNPVKSGGIKTALDTKLDTLVSGTSIKTINSISLLGSGDIAVQAPLTFDSTPTASSTNPVTSDGIASKFNNYITLDTSQNVTGEKTFVGAKKIKFKKSTTNDKLGFTLYDNNNKELSYLEYNTGDLCLGSYYSSSSLQVKSRAGFKMSDVSSGINAVYRILTPYAADAKTPFNLTSTISDFYFPLGVSNGITTLVTNSTGLLDISSFFNNYYTKTDTDTLLSGKQSTLVSGTDIKTINGNSLLESGNMELQPTLVSGTNIKTVNGKSIVGSGNTQINASDIDYDGEDGDHVIIGGDPVDECLKALDDGISQVVNDLELKQDLLVSGTNIKTVNGTSLLGSGDLAVVSVDAGDINVLQSTGDSLVDVMSQKAVTEYGRKVTAADLAGTSDYIQSKLAEEGWALGKYLNSSIALANSNNNCVSFYIPMSNVAGHSITLYYAIAGSNSNYMAWYNSEKTYISGCYYIQNANNYRTVTLGTTSSWKSVAYLRITLNQSKLNECYVLDNTTGEYYFKGDDYLNSINASNLTLDTFLNKFIVQELGQSKTVAVSQKTITDAINYNINIERGTGVTLNSNADYRYLKLTPKAVSLLNASDKMTFMFSTRSTGGTQDYRYFRFGNGNPASNGPDGTNGVYLGWSYSRNLSANGVDYSLNKPNSNTAPTPDVWIVTWDRINGVVKFYNRTTLVNTLTSDSYKKTQFVNSSGVLTILGGDNNTRIYDIRLFDFDISNLFNNSDIKNEIDYLDGAGILPSQFLSNYTVANSDSSFNTLVNNFQGGGYSATCTYTLDGDNYHIVVKDGVTTSQACGGKPYYLGENNRAQLEKLEFEVVSGVIRTSIDPNNASTVHYYHIYDSNNNEISDYSNIGVGSYTLIRTSSTTGARLDFYKVSGNVEVIMNRNMQYKPISCVFHWSGDTMYNKKFYDDQTKEFITLYTTRTCDTPYTGHTMVKTPQRVILNTTSNMLPHYSGEMAITGGKVYIGMPDYTWKQINNS